MSTLIEHFNKIKPTLTDLNNCEDIFLQLYSNLIDHKTSNHINILELGVYSIKRVPEEMKNLPGQSTKVFMSLCSCLGYNKYISVDVDDCQDTIDHCEKFMDIKLKDHKFVQSTTLDFDVEQYFPDGIDFVFLDSSHDDDYPSKIGLQGGGLGETYKELCKFSKYLNLEGYILIHDTMNDYVETSYGNNASGAIDKFLDENKDFKFTEFNPNKNGLGLLSYV